MITSQILADSITPAGNRLTTFLLTYPRFIHAEFMTHRCFSRNAASSRAIPIRKMIAAICNNPAVPEYWGANEKGMQAGKQVILDDLDFAKREWLQGAHAATLTAEDLDRYGLHKQIANRPLEPFSHITVVATSAEKGLRNFFAQRAHKDAQPEFQVLAYRMLAAWLKSKDETLTHLDWGHWHLPEFPGVAWTGDLWTNIKIATAHCARTSYLSHEGAQTVAGDLELHDKLIAGKHMSPLEHCAQAVQNMDGSNFGYHWLQYRKTIEGECQQPTNYDLHLALKNRPDWFAL
jgi:thymidylate synthase ThyX